NMNLFVPGNCWNGLLAFLPNGLLTNLVNEKSTISSVEWATMEGMGLLFPEFSSKEDIVSKRTLFDTRKRVVPILRPIGVYYGRLSLQWKYFRPRTYPPLRMESS